MAAQIVSYKDSILKKLRDGEAKAVASATSHIFNTQLMHLQNSGSPSQPGQYPARETGVGAAGLSRILKRKSGKVGYAQTAFYMSILASKYGKRLGLVTTVREQWEVLQQLVISNLALAF